uniref:NADH-ubiquinone oxidoreductase chain 3 n=1 Tax=Abrus expansivus TaxID=2664682 RepID=A0A5Q0RZ43_9HEMI|nr:NADH dehydrogenase subunit 3 [Abrus expansivus]QGA47523.1 NADH dehydrogenase subunit 3 [Abrus expansivus]
MKIMSFSLIIVISILTVMTMMVLMLSKKMLADMEKITPFECGFNPMSYTRLPFSIHFFMIAVIFLIFDIEIIMILPMILTLKSSLIKMWMATSASFLLILLIGLFHEWKNGMIDWTQ